MNDEQTPKDVCGEAIHFGDVSRNKLAVQNNEAQGLGKCWPLVLTLRLIEFAKYKLSLPWPYKITVTTPRQVPVY